MDTKKIVVLFAVGAAGLFYVSRAKAQISPSISNVSGGASILDTIFSATGAYRSYDIMSYKYIPGALPSYDTSLSPLDNLNIAAAYQQNSAVENERVRGTAASKAALGAASNYYLAVANKVGAAIEAQLDSRMYPPGGSPSWRRNYSNQVLALYKAEAAPSGGLGGLGNLITASNVKTAATFVA